MDTHAPAPPRLNQRQAEQYIGASPDLLKRLRRKKAVRFYRLGHRSISYDRESLDAFLYRTRVEARTR